MSPEPSALENIDALTDGELIAKPSAAARTVLKSWSAATSGRSSATFIECSSDYEGSLDVTQEVFIKVYNSLERYSSEYKFSTWLYRIAHNAAIDHMRRNSGKSAEH